MELLGRAANIGKRVSAIITAVYSVPIVQRVSKTRTFHEW